MAERAEMSLLLGKRLAAQQAAARIDQVLRTDQEIAAQGGQSIQPRNRHRSSLREKLTRFSLATLRRSVANLLTRSPIRWAAATTGLRMTDLRRLPDVVGRVRRPANAGKRLAAVVVRGGITGEATARPPVKQRSPIGAPTADRGQALEEAACRRRTTRRLSVQRWSCPD